MKNILIIILINSFTIISYSSFSQKNYKELREIQEIKQIIKDDTNKKMSLLFFISYDGITRLPLYFNSNKEFYIILKNLMKWEGFIQSKEFNLSKNDCDVLNRAIINDTNRLYIQKKWFVNNKVVFHPNSHEPYLMKPIFFKNYTRCFIAEYRGGGFLLSHFLKKKDNHWVYDKSYVGWIEEPEISKRPAFLSGPFFLHIYNNKLTIQNQIQNKHLKSPPL